MSAEEEQLSPSEIHPVAQLSAFGHIWIPWGRGGLGALKQNEAEKSYFCIKAVWESNFVIGRPVVGICGVK